MKTKSEKETHLQMIKHGDLDIIVGTHSLLGDRVVYNNLGLLVVDEEQVSPLSSFFQISNHFFTFIIIHISVFILNYYICLTAAKKS